jgi:hypothetical protein
MIHLLSESSWDTQLVVLIVTLLLAAGWLVVLVRISPVGTRKITIALIAFAVCVTAIWALSRASLSVGTALFWGSLTLRCGHGSMVFVSCGRGDCEEIERVSDARTVGILRSRDRGYFRDKRFPLVMKKRPNKAPEPTTMAVTPRAMALCNSYARPAAARGAPAMVVAHL